MTQTAELGLNHLLVASFGIAAVVDIAWPFALGIWLARRFGLNWRVFLLGALVFFVSQMVLRLPLITILGGALQGRIQPDTPVLFLWFGFLALSAGLFEETGRWLGYRFLFRRDPRTWHNALMYGTGHAGFESAIFVGLLSVGGALISYVTLVVFDVGAMPGVTPEAAEQLAIARQQFAQLHGWEPLIGAVERILTGAVHISLAVLVLQSFVRGGRVHSGRWLLAAIGWHTIANLSVLLALYTAQPTLGYTASLLVSEAVLLVAALVSLWIIFHFRPRVGTPNYELRIERDA